MQRKILIIGLGVSGRSCAAFLLQQGFFVVAVDRKIEALRLDLNIKALIDLGLEARSDASIFSLEDFFQIIVSPGVDPSHPLVQKGLHLGIEVIGEIELAFRYLKNRCLPRTAAKSYQPDRPQYIGITGTNGKTTTTLLTTHVLNQMGIAARALGNVGSSLSGYLVNSCLREVLVIELSSFQLETVQTRALDAALVLNITPNHLDRHPSMEAYSTAKLQIQNCLKESSNRFYVSSQVATEYGAALKKFEIFDAPISPVEHTKGGGSLEQNIQAAYCLCSLFGISSSDFYEKMKTFQKPSHRVEWVAEIEGITYYNDSKATNIDAVRYAVEQLRGPIILIAGGVDKGSSYKPWIDLFFKKVKKIVVFGQAAEKIARELMGFFSIEKVESLDQALKVAKHSAIEKDTVLFSPGCSSYDQFLNYEARGEEFKRRVLELGWKEKKPF